MSDYFARAAARAVPDAAPVRRAGPALDAHVELAEPGDETAAARNLPDDPVRGTEEPMVRPAVTRAETVPPAPAPWPAEQPLGQTGSGDRWLEEEPAPSGREPVLPSPAVEHSDLVDTGPARPAESADGVLVFDRVAPEPAVVAPRPESLPDPDVAASIEAEDRAADAPPPVAPLDPLVLADAAIFDALGPPPERVVAVSPPAVAESRGDPEPAPAGSTVVIDRLTVEIVDQAPAPEAPATRPRPRPSGLLAPTGRFDSRWGW